MSTGSAIPDVQPLDAARIKTELAGSLANSLEISVLQCTDSTNRDITALPAHQQHGHVVLAEQQTAGRGRHGRVWHSPSGSNLYLSLGWRFDKTVEDLGCLSLATGVAIIRALSSCGVNGATLKWPNDVRLESRKLAGVLIEVAGDTAGPCQAVIGVGINVKMPADTQLDQPWADLSGLENPPGRNRLAAVLIAELAGAMAEFAKSGFATFQAEWNRADELAGRAVTVIQGTARYHGVARGLSANGGLLVRVTDDMHEFHSGDVSVRAE